MKVYNSWSRFPCFTAGKDHPRKVEDGGYLKRTWSLIREIIAHRALLPKISAFFEDTYKKFGILKINF